MRDDSVLSKAIAIFLFAATILVLTGLALFTADQNIQTRIKEETSTFVDDCRTKGEIDPTKFTQYLAIIHACGEFDAEIQVETLVVYPNIADNGEVDAGKLEKDYLVVDHDTIIQEMYMADYDPNLGYGNETSKYILSKGDRLKVVVRRTGAGLTAFANLIGLGGDEGDRICQYSGMVAHSK